MSYLEVPGAEIYYEFHEPDLKASESHTGSVKTVTLINGHTRSSSDFKMMARHLTGHGFRVLLLDNRGSGKSLAHMDFDLNDLVQDIVTIWRTESISASHVLGISMGGMIAQWLAIHHGALIDRLVLVSTCPNRTFIRDHGSYEWPRDEAAIRTKLSGYFSPDFLGKNGALVTAMARQMAKSAVDGDFLTDSKRQMNAMKGFDALPRLGDIRARTLIIHGELDNIVPENASEIFAERIKDSNRVVVPGVGHLLLAECPRELYELATDFFVAS